LARAWWSEWLKTCVIKNGWMNSLSPFFFVERIVLRTLGRKGKKRIIAPANRRISCRRIYRNGVQNMTGKRESIYLFLRDSIWTTFKSVSYLRNTPPRRLAFKHSGGDSRLCTSATVTLYLLVLLSNDNRPGTEQNTSDGCAFPVNIAFSLLSEGFISAKLKMWPLEWS